VFRGRTGGELAPVDFRIAGANNVNCSPVDGKGLPWDFEANDLHRNGNNKAAALGEMDVAIIEVVMVCWRPLARLCGG
jgi:hypothetical protein